MGLEALFGKFGDVIQRLTTEAELLVWEIRKLKCFEYLQRRRLHNLPGQPVPGLRHPQSKEVLPHVPMELPMLQFVPVASCPVAGHHWKESGPVLLTPTLKTFTGISKVPSQPSLLHAKQAQLPPFQPLPFCDSVKGKLLLPLLPLVIPNESKLGYSWERAFKRLTKVVLCRGLRSSTCNNPEVFLMQLFDSFSIPGILAYDFAGYNQWVHTVTFPMMEDDFSESVKTVVEQSLKRCVPYLDFGSLNY